MPEMSRRDRTYMFVSYTQRDAEFARRLARRLSEQGLRVFDDASDVAVGEELGSILSRAVRGARHFVAVMSPEYFESAWASRELNLALNDGSAVIPVMRRDCRPPLSIVSKSSADFRDDEKFEESLAKLLASLDRRRRRRPAGAGSRKSTVDPVRP